MTAKRVAIVGYGTIGERVALGLSGQPDMVVSGVADIAASLPVRALVESRQGYPIYCSLPERRAEMEAAGIPVAGLLDDLLEQSDAVVDATSPGVGEKNRAVYAKHGLPAVFQGGEKEGFVDATFSPYFNYEKCLGLKYLKMFSCNTTGIARQASACDRKLGLKEMICLIVRRSADISETHKGPVDALLPSPMPSHQSIDFHKVAPHIQTTTGVVTAPVCHGHVTMMIFKVAKPTTREEVVELFRSDSRTRVFRLKDGFISTSHIFDYNRDRLSPRGDMYEVPVWDETVYLDQDGTRVYSMNMIPQEAIVVPENIDAIRCLLRMQENGDDAVRKTNEGLGLTRA